MRPGDGQSMSSSESTAMTTVPHDVDDPDDVDNLDDLVTEICDDDIVEASADELADDVDAFAARLRAEISTRIDNGDIRVPPFPNALITLRRLEARAADFDSFADVVAGDPALAARVLRVANSAAVGHKAPITTLSKAVRTLGITVLIRVALADGVMAHACRDGLLVAHKDRAWRQAVTSAVLSAALAPLRALPAEQVFVCGLLHDFGRLIAVQVLEEILADGRLVPVKELSDQGWSDLIDDQHIRLGEIVAESWLLPEVILECISTHHQPLADSPNNRLVEMIAGVDAVIDLLEREPMPSRAEVTKVSGFAATEVDVVFQSLGSLAEMISSFSVERSGRPRPTKDPVKALAKEAVKQVVKAAVTSSTLPATTVFKAIALATKRRFELISMTVKSVVVDGDEGLAVNQVFRMRFDFPMPLDMWLRVTDNQRVGSKARVSATPFALNDADAAVWRALASALGSPSSNDPTPGARE